ncbi:adenosylcobinamide-GDP ribazoletransferase [Alphaproteobacteria bacterium]|jgi:adenosylcobinamide-GDP ribazoletransferase|nr:adenosylcobinamide-GDP ribazoletransferase [Alphaproteobacteria bacterium]
MTKTPKPNTPITQRDAGETPMDKRDTANSKGPRGNSTTEKSSVPFDEALALDTRLGEFLLAIGFFTRLPVPMDNETAARPLADASWSFPIAGLIVGLCGSTVITLGAGLNLPPLVLAFLAIGPMICLTGALHEDGLADCADGLWSGDNSEKRLTIMRDSRIGAFGVIALVLMLGIKATAIAHLLTAAGTWNTILGILAAACLSRGALPCVMRSAPLASENGQAANAGKPGQQEMLVAGGISVLICLLCLGFGITVFSILIGGSLCAAFTVIAINRIGGYNGDVLGAQQQILDVATLTVASSML